MRHLKSPSIEKKRALKLAGDHEFEPRLGHKNTYIKRPCGKVDECAGFRYLFFVCVCLPPPPSGWHIGDVFFPNVNNFMLKKTGGAFFGERGLSFSLGKNGKNVLKNKYRV